MYERNSMKVHENYLPETYNAKNDYTNSVADFKENNCFHTNLSPMSYFFVGRLNKMLRESDNVFMNDRQNNETKGKGVHFFAPFFSLANLTTVNKRILPHLQRFIKSTLSVMFSQIGKRNIRQFFEL